MRFWYSVNGKKFFRISVTLYNGGASAYYGTVTDGNNFKATDGTEGTHLQAAFSKSSADESYAHIRNLIYQYIMQPLSTNSSNTRFYLCLDNDTFDDTKYQTSGQLDTSTYTININRSYPGSSVLTITNSGASSITFNSLEYIIGSETGMNYLAADNNTRGTAKTLLIHAIILDEAVTVPAGGTYSITYTT